MKAKKSFHSYKSSQSTIALAAMIMLFIFGMSSLAFGLSTQISPANPETVVAGISPPKNKSVTKTMKSLPFSNPLNITIPSIEVDSELIQIGKNPDGTIEVPLHDNTHKAAWYKHGASPGQVGSSVIAGHVDGDNGQPSVFFNLGALKPGDEIHILREDGVTAIFEVETTGVFDKDSFPTNRVYGFKNHASLTLITCGGDFNEQSGGYQSNVVVSAKLVDSK